MKKTFGIPRTRILLAVLIIAIIAAVGIVDIIVTSDHTHSATSTTRSITRTSSTTSCSSPTSSNTTYTSSGTASSSSSTNSPSQGSITPVGVFYYLWYGYNNNTSQWSGGVGSSHWNDSVSGLVEDRPLQGYYSMMNNHTISSQITEMEQSGINFAVVSWWGWGVSNFSNPTINPSEAAINNATRNLFKLVSADFPSFKLAIMVDAFNSTSLSPENYTSVYNYVSSNFYSKYPDLVLRNQTDGEPYLFWFNPLDPYNVESNSSFENIVTGNNPYVNLTFWLAPKSFLQGEQNQIMSNYEGEPNISSDGIVSIIPRYNDYALYNSHERNSYIQFDVSYNESLYQNEWNYVLNHSRSINMVLIYSWNEYHERSEIEPHYDSSNSSISPFYLTNLTSYYVSKFQNRSISQPSFMIPSLDFNITTALNFYSTDLNTSLGLMSETPHSSTIFLADDQALDYIALLDLSKGTSNSSALAIANQINSSIQGYCGLYKYWNSVFVLLQPYQNSSWGFLSGYNKSQIIAHNGPYTIQTIIFNYTMGASGYAQYTDLELYYTVYNLQRNNYSAAENAFITANRFWDGSGFTDNAYATNPNSSSYHQYASYKLALDLIVWKMLNDTSETHNFAQDYSPVIIQITSIFPKLQAPNGGVYTSYVLNNTISTSYENEINNTNGETTSLFVLAYYGTPIS